jgi:hypothetical protein
MKAIFTTMDFSPLSKCTKICYIYKYYEMNYFKLTKSDIFTRPIYKYVDDSLEMQRPKQLGIHGCIRARNSTSFLPEVYDINL